MMESAGWNDALEGFRRLVELAISRPALRTVELVLLMTLGDTENLRPSIVVQLELTDVFNVLDGCCGGRVQGLLVILPVSGCSE